MARRRVGSDSLEEVGLPKIGPTLVPHPVLLHTIVLPVFLMLSTGFSMEILETTLRERTQEWGQLRHVTT